MSLLSKLIIQLLADLIIIMTVKNAVIKILVLSDLLNKIYSNHDRTNI